MSSAHSAMPRVRFSAEKSAETKPSISPPPSTSLLNRIKLWTAPITSYAGGLLLVVASFMPGATTKPTLPPAAPTAEQVSVTESPEISQTQAETRLAQLRDILVQAGWTLGSIGGMAAGYNQIVAGQKTRQPSMTLGAWASLLTAPVLMFAPSIPVRAAYMMSIAMCMTGLRNNIHNQYRRKEGEAPREFSPGEGSGLQTAMAGLKFVVEDHVMLVKDAGKSVLDVFRHPVQTARSFKDALTQSGAYFITRKRQELPDFMTPNPDANNIGATLVYIGCTPLLFTVGDPGAVARFGENLIKAGGLTANLSLFAVGAKESGWANRALLVGVPLGGLADLTTDLGMGERFIGTGTIAGYFAQEGDPSETKQPEPEQTPELAN